jgi:hypothetical protein
MASGNCDDIARKSLPSADGPHYAIGRLPETEAVSDCFGFSLTKAAYLLAISILLPLFVEALAI